MKGRNYKLSDTLAAALQEAPSFVKEEIALRMDHYIKEYTRNLKLHNAESVAFAFMELLDHEYKRTKPPEGEKISCKKGCANCCSINVDISKEEAILLLEHSKEENIKIDWKKLKTQKKYNHDTYFDLEKNLRKCVFLADDNTCKVYDYRPLSCRKFASLDNPEKCDLENGKQKVKRFVSVMAEIVACAAMTATEFNSMPSLLLKYKSQVYGQENQNK